MATNLRGGGSFNINSFWI